MDRLLRSRLAPALSLPLDISLVVLFVLIGRRSHENGYELPGLLLAIVPWLIGLAGGWALIRWRRGEWPDRVPHAVTLAVVTVVVGLLVRVLMGQSVGEGVGGVLSFAGVALAFLLTFLLGWRVLAALVLRGTDQSR